MQNYIKELSTANICLVKENNGSSKLIYLNLHLNTMKVYIQTNSEKFPSHYSRTLYIGVFQFGKQY